MQPCPSRFYADRAQECKKCTPGMYSNAERTECLFCPPGFFASDDGAANCTRCAAGFETENEGSRACTKVKPSKNVSVKSVKWIEPFAEIGLEWIERPPLHKRFIMMRENSQDAQEDVANATLHRSKNEVWSGRVSNLRFGLKYYFAIAGENAAGRSAASAISDFVRIRCPLLACCGVEEDRHEFCPFNFSTRGGVLQEELIAEVRAYRVSDVIFEECPFADACLGANVCLKGYTGMLCHKCESQYARRGDHQCGPCDAWSTVYTAIAILAFICICIYFIKSTLSSSKKTLEIEMGKIAMSGTQALTVLGRYPLRWPDAILNIFSVAGGLFSGAGDVISFTCAMDNAGGSRYFRGSAVILAAPLVVVAGAGFFWLFKMRSKSDSERKNIRSNFVVSVMVIMFMVLPTLNQTAFQLLTCRRVGHGFRAAGDYDVNCYESAHLTFIMGIAVPGLLLYSVGVPIMAISLLLRLHRRGKLFQPRESSYSSSVYAFLYGGYKPDRYFWEVVIMVRKVLLNLILVVLASASASSQGLVVLIVLQACIALHIHYQPYAEEILNRIELCSLVLAASMLLLGLFLFDDAMEIWIKTAITLLMVSLVAVSLIGFIITLCRRIKASRLKSIREGVSKVHEKATKLEAGFEMAIRRLRSASRSNPSSDIHGDKFAIDNPMSKHQSPWSKRTSEDYDGAEFYYNEERQWEVPEGFDETASS
eukprot:g1990.t1